MENNYFDEIVKSKLENLERQHSPNDWTRMEQMLDKDDRLQRRLLFYKGAELLVFALIVWGCSQLWQSDWDWEQQNANQETTIANPTFAEEDADTKLEPTTNSIEQKPVEIPQKQNIDILHPLKTDYSAPILAPVLEVEEPVASLDVRREIISPIRTIQSVPMTNPLALTTIPQINKVTAASEDNSIEANNIGSLALLEHTVSPLSMMASMNEKAKQYGGDKRKFFIGLQASANVLQVQSPYYSTKAYDLKADSRYGKGWSTEASFGYQHKRFDWETGVRYAEHTYEPRQITLLRYSPEAGLNGHKLKDITLKTASIPLKFRYHFLKNKKWSVYAVAGASLDVALLYDYEYDYFTTDDDGNLFVASSASEVRLSRENLPIEGEGLLYGDKLTDNLFVTADAGFGVERYLGKNFSVFAEPVYQHQIFDKQLQNKDVFNTLNVNLGARFSL